MWEDLQGALGCEGCELALPRVGPSHPDPTAMKCSELSRGFFPLPLGVKGLELSTRPSSQQPPDARTLNSSSLPPAPAAAGGVGLGSPSAEPEARGSSQSSPQPNSPGKNFATAQCLMPRWALEGEMTLLLTPALGRAHCTVGEAPKRPWDATGSG